MNPDVLDLAVRAYRVDPSSEIDRSAETLGRILENQRRRRPLRAVLWLALVSGSAVAVAAVHELPRIRAVLADNPDSTSTVAAAIPATSKSAPTAPATATAPPPALSEPPRPATRPVPVAPAPVVPASARRLTRASPRPLSPVAAQASEPPSGPSDPEDALFEEVQRDHRSASTAEDLAGWQRYLTAYPDGRFAPEARYRRAEALARLGDENAALSAFLWFQRNPEGSSRREDALRWVRALTAER